MAAVNNSEETWADKQNRLKRQFDTLRPLPISPDRKKKTRELEEKYFQVCRGEAKDDMKKNYLHQLTDVYVEASGTVKSRGTQENSIHAMRRSVTLSARLVYDVKGAVDELRRVAEATDKQTNVVRFLSWVIAGFAAVQIILRVVCG